MIMISAKKAKERSSYNHDKKIVKQEKSLMRIINREISKCNRKGIYETTFYARYLDSFYDKEAIENVAEKLRSTPLNYDVELDYRRSTRCNCPNMTIRWRDDKE